MRIILIVLWLSVSVAAQTPASKLDDQVNPIVASFKGKVSLFTSCNHVVCR